MTAADILGALLKVNLASGAAILGVVALRRFVRHRFGARLAYGLWLLPALAGAAVLIPARQVVVMRSAGPVAAAAVRMSQTFGAPSAAAATGLDRPTLLVGVWLAGAVAAALIMAFLQHRFVSRAREGGVGPAVIGLIAPRIVMPGDFAERYSREEQALVLAHEQAHLARQDSRLNGLLAAAQCLNWFNPLVHLGARLMRIDQELACDEAVVSRFPEARRAYAEVLLKAQLAVLPPLPVGCYWPSRSQHPLVERIAMLKRKRIGRARRWIGAATLSVLCAGAGAGAWAAQPTKVRTVFSAASPGAVVQPAVAEATVRATPTVQFRPARAGKAAPASPGGVVQSILVLGNREVDVGTILSRLPIARGQAVTSATLAAGEKALRDTGLFDDVGLTLEGGDLQVWVAEKRPNLRVAAAPEILRDTVVSVGGGVIPDRELRERIRRLAMAKGVQVTEDNMIGLEAEVLSSLAEEQRQALQARDGTGLPAGPISVMADHLERFADARMIRFRGDVRIEGDLSQAFAHVQVDANMPATPPITRRLVADAVEFWTGPSGKLEAVIVNGLRSAE